MGPADAASAGPFYVLSVSKDSRYCSVGLPCRDRSGEPATNRSLGCLRHEGIAIDGHRQAPCRVRAEPGPYNSVGVETRIDDGRAAFPLGYVPPVEYEEAFYRRQETQKLVPALMS